VVDVQKIRDAKLKIE
jgi:hypothetical protein